MRRAAVLLVLAALVMTLALAWLEGEPTERVPVERPLAMVPAEPAPAPAAPSLAAPATPPAAPTPPVGARWFGFCPVAGESPASVRPHELSVSVDGEHAEALRQAFADLHAADARGEPEAAADALRRAAQLVPREPTIALALGRRLASTPDLGGARDALAIYLAARPGDRDAARLAARLGTAIEIQDGYGRRDRRGVTVLASRDVDAESLLALVDTSLDDASRLLGVPRRGSLTVVVYPSRSELLAVSCVPPWSIGLYDGTLRLVADVMTTPDARWRLVRHESLHAALAVAAPRAPTWLHEGSAQYFAGELTPGHRHSYRLMARDRTYIPFASIEGSFLGFDASDDAGLAYHQSRAMIDALVERRGERVIADAVAYLRGAEATSGLVEAIGGGFRGDDLLAYLARYAEAR